MMMMMMMMMMVMTTGKYLHELNITNSVKQSLSSEANTSSATQEVSHVFIKPEGSSPH